MPSSRREGLLSRHGPRLLAETIAVARAAGCARVDFFSRRRPGGIGGYSDGRCCPARATIWTRPTSSTRRGRRTRNWQLTPGDRDYH
ncbi:MAG: hypothetical protein R3E53_05650 [Myxococcota bacterium]